MKKLFTLTKTFLVAAGLCVGMSVWAYEIPSGMEVKEVLIGTLSAGNVAAETFDGVSPTVPSFTNSGNFSISSELPTDQWNSLASALSGNVLRLGSRTTHEIDFSSVVSSGQIVLSADFYVGTHQKIIKFIDEDNNIVARFVYPDKNASNGRVYGTQYLFVDVDNEAVFSSTPQINDTYNGTRNREYRITELVIDLDAKTISYSGKVMDRRSSTNKWCDDNATITLSKSVTIKGMIIDASGVGDNSYYAYYDNMKLFSVGNAADTYNYTINAVTGGTTIKTLATGSATSGNTYGTYLPKAILYEGQYYVLNDANVTNLYANYTMGDANVTKEITYSLNANMKAFWECENLSYVGHSWYSGGNLTNNSECSNGATICPYSGTSNGIKTTSTIGSGIYDITIKPYRWGDAATDYTLQYSTDNVNWTTIETVPFGSTSNDAYIADNILIPDDSYLRLLSPSGTPRHSLDYIYVERTGDAAVPATLGTNGYATFACPYPLDLTTANMPEGLTAYKASVSGTTVTFTELNQTVPANTGVLLQGEAGESYNIPVVASGTEVTENAFLVNTDGTTFAGDNNYYYFGLLKNTLTFGTFDPSGVAIPASKAYLKVLKSSLDAGARLNISFADDETTGIADVRGKMSDVRGKMSDVRGGYYNLRGQRVDQPQKGLYIINGKKVVIK